MRTRYATRYGLQSTGTSRALFCRPNTFHSISACLYACKVTRSKSRTSASVRSRRLCYARASTPPNFIGAACSLLILMQWPANALGASGETRTS